MGDGGGGNPSSRLRFKFVRALFKRQELLRTRCTSRLVLCEKVFLQTSQQMLESSSRGLD